MERFRLCSEYRQGWAPLHFKGVALTLPLKLPKLSGAPAPTPFFSKKRGAPAPAPHKWERRSSCRSFNALDVYKKKTSFILFL